MQWIVDNLFVGNKLATGRDRHQRRQPRRPAQHPLADHLLLLPGRQHHAAAAGAGLDPDLYGSVDDIRAHGQTIVYCVHDKIGHLGIFVSGGVAKKEHAEFASNIDLIDCLPPGLYEAVLTPRTRRSATGWWSATMSSLRAAHARRHPGTRRQRPRGRALLRGGGPPSEINLGLYRTMLQPCSARW